MGFIKHFSSEGSSIILDDEFDGDWIEDLLAQDKDEL